MSIEIKSSHGITISLNDFSSLVELMSGEQQVELIETLSCYDAVIKHVTEQIIDIYGMTENGLSGSSLCGHEKFSGKGTVLDKARLAIAMASGEVSRQVIETQARNLNELQSRLNQVTTELYEIKYKTN